MTSRALAVLALVTLAGCASYPTVPVSGASYQTGANFSAYQTFDFITLPPGVARLGASLDYFAVDGAIDRALSNAGMARALGGSPDLVVAYYQGGKDVDVTAWGYTTAGNPVVSVIDVPSSCLVVDLVDARSKVLVWRGIATDALVSPSALAPSLQQMLRGWPPRS